jgi:bla regulator protein BlaR1
MIPRFISEMWSASAPAVGNHLWQSTLFAIAVGLMTLLLRSNRAQVRYWLWVTASLKFLIPFSLLIGLGSHLAWTRASTEATRRLDFALQVGQPFSQAIAASVISQPNDTTLLQKTFNLAPLLLIVWLCGSVAVVALWYVRWRRIAGAVREATPLYEGREAEALRRVEQLGMGKRIEMRLSRSSLEPGIFGIARPVLLWPEGISRSLTDKHLEVILAHEVRHVRRWDNLAAAMHMVVEALFWFHPLVWWMGARIVEERERACDEEVLDASSDRQVYAESILKVCEFCVESPLSCVAGVTGSDLKKRIAHIMSERAARSLNVIRKLMLSTAGLLAIALPIGTGLLNSARSVAAAQAAKHLASPTRSEFDTASVTQNKSGSDLFRWNVPNNGETYPPNGGLFSGTNVRLISYIYFAYKLTGNQFQLLMPQLPQWVIQDRFDIQANATGAPTTDQMRLMMQSLLADRFKLSVHYERRRLPVFGLVLVEAGKTGPQLQPNGDKSGCSTSSGIAGLPTICGSIEGMPSSPSGRLRVGARAVPIGLLASTLAQMGNFDRAVVDRTELSGNFDFSFEWSPQLNGPGTPNANIRQPESGRKFQDDLREQLGLRLESQEGEVEVIVLDHIEKSDLQTRNVSSTPVLKSFR